MLRELVVADDMSIRCVVKSGYLRYVWARSPASCRRLVPGEDPLGLWDSTKVASWKRVAELRLRVRRSRTNPLGVCHPGIAAAVSPLVGEVLFFW